MKILLKYSNWKNNLLRKKKRIDNISITSKKMSSSYLDFLYGQVVNQLKCVVIYKEERWNLLDVINVPAKIIRIK